MSKILDMCAPGTDIAPVKTPPLVVRDFLLEYQNQEYADYDARKIS